MGLRGIGARPIEKVSRVGPAEYKANLDAARPWEIGRKTRAEKVVAFLETLPITSGNLTGQNFRVRDWQWRDIIEPLYRTDDAGHRIAREGFISMPRRNGKSAIVSGLALCHLCGPEAIQRGNVASAAAERDQASIIFDELCAIIERVPWMMNRLIIRNFKKDIEDAETGSTYKALSSESKTKHGKGYSFWIYDELAQAPDRKLYDVFSTSGGSWDEPLGIVMSTQSDDPRHIMSVLYDGAKQIQDGVVIDPSQHACIYSAPMDADWKDEATWFGCNPALGDFRSTDDMRMLARKAERMPASEQTFRLLYLNQRISGSVKLIPRPTWVACGAELKIEDYHGRHCVGAIDLSGSGKNDLTALVLLFDGDGHLDAFPFFWAAEAGLEAAEGRDRVPYRQWAKDGHLLTTPGHLLDYGFIANKLAELAAKFKIEALAIDPWNIERLVDAINALNVNLTFQKHDQHIQGMNPAVRAMEDVIFSGILRHNRSPVMDWCIDNAEATQDSSGNRKLDKRKASGRIDGAQALAMAANLAATPAKKTKFSMHFV